MQCTWYDFEKPPQTICKEWRGTRILRVDITFSKQLPRVSSRSNSAKKAIAKFEIFTIAINFEHNIEQHLYSFDNDWD
jgi:hypothetical protein